MTTDPWRLPAWLPPFMLGSMSLLLQLGVMRELGLLFAGNEVVLGLSLAAWLAGTAFGTAGPWLPPVHTVSLGWKLALSMIPLASMIFLRSAHAWVGGYGTDPGPLALYGLAAGACLPPAALTGWWLAGLMANTPSLKIGRLFSAELLGSCLAGVGYTFGLAHVWKPFALAGGAVWLFAWLAVRDRQNRAAALAFLMLLPLLAVATGPLESWFPSRIPGTTLWSGYTARSHYRLLRHQAAFSVYASGQHAYSLPDALRGQTLAFLTLRLHPRPARIAVAGASPEWVSLLLADPAVASVDWFEEDAEGRRQILRQLPEAWTTKLADPRLTLQTGDMRRRLRSRDDAYDVIVTDAGLPTNLASNRLFTKEFFQEARKRLLPGGYFLLCCPVSPERLDAGEARGLAAIWSAMAAAFPAPQLLAGDLLMMVGTEHQEPETHAVRRMTAALASEPLAFPLLTPGDWRWRWDPQRGQALRATLAGFQSPANADRLPLAVGYQSWSWLRQAGRESFAALALMIMLLGFFLRQQPGVRIPGLWLMAAAGGCLMYLEIAVATAYQYSRGNLWEEIGLLFAVTMAGFSWGSRLASPRRAATLPAGLLALLSVAGYHAVMLSQGVPVVALGILGLAGVACGMLWRGQPAAGLKPAAVWGWDAWGSALGAGLAGTCLLPAWGAASGLLPAALLVATAWLASRPGRAGGRIES